MIVDVPLGDRAYPIHIAPGLLGNAAPLLGPLAPRGRLALVTDANVAALHLPAFTAGLAAAGIAVDEIILPPGEATKDWATLAACHRTAAATGCRTRRCRGGARRRGDR